MNWNTTLTPLVDRSASAVVFQTLSSGLSITKPQLNGLLVTPNPINNHNKQDRKGNLLSGEAILDSVIRSSEQWNNHLPGTKRDTLPRLERTFTKTLDRQSKPDLQLAFRKDSIYHPKQGTGMSKSSFKNVQPGQNINYNIPPHRGLHQYNLSTPKGSPSPHSKTSTYCTEKVSSKRNPSFTRSSPASAFYHNNYTGGNSKPHGPVGKEMGTPTNSLNSSEKGDSLRRREQTRFSETLVREGLVGALDHKGWRARPPGGGGHRRVGVENAWRRQEVRVPSFNYPIIPLKTDLVLTLSVAAAVILYIVLVMAIRTSAQG